jgi:biotin carboxyl carrier protein
MSDRLARDIQLLAELFKAGGWRELRVEADGIELLFSTDPDAAGLGQTHSVKGVRPDPVDASFCTPGEGNARPPTSSEQTEQEQGAEPTWAAVTAPNLGTFYRSPKPGAAPFVEIGDRITADAEICLLEVMKLFTSVKAGVAGTVRRICTGDAELVEGGQVLFYIEPE